MDFMRTFFVHTIVGPELDEICSRLSLSIHEGAAMCHGLCLLGLVQEKFAGFCRATTDILFFFAMGTRFYVNALISGMVLGSMTTIPSWLDLGVAE